MYVVFILVEMRPTRPLRVGTLTGNIEDAKQVYQNQAKVIQELVARTEALEKTILDDHESIETNNKHNKDIIDNIQAEIAKLQSTITSIANIDVAAAKKIIDDLSEKISDLSTRQDKIRETDLVELRKDINDIKRVANDTANIKNSVNSLSSALCNVDTDVKNIKSFTDDNKDAIKTLTTDVNNAKEDISILSGNFEVVNEKVDNINTDIDKFKQSTLQSVATIENNINSLKKESLSSLKQELLDIVKKALPSVNASSYEFESDSNEIDTRDINSHSDYPFEASTNAEGCDALEFGGVYISATEKDGKRLCSITNSYGGIAIDKEDALDRWIIERSNDKQLKFHLNTESDSPLTINSKGISTNKLKLGKCSATHIVNAFTQSNINSHSIPTTKAIYDFIHSNMLLNGVSSIAEQSQPQSRVPPLNFPPVPSLGINPSASMAPGQYQKQNSGAVSARGVNDKYADDPYHRNGRRSSVQHKNKGNLLDIDPPSPTSPNGSNGDGSLLIQSPKSCGVSTIKINGKTSLLVNNDSCSISLKDNSNTYTVTANNTEGLRVNDAFRLCNDDGLLCYISATNIPAGMKVSDLSGLFMAYGKGVKKIKSVDERPNILYVPEVYIPSNTTSVIIGVAKKAISTEFYTKKNRMFSLTVHRNTDVDELVDEESESSSNPSATPTKGPHKYYFLSVCTKGITIVKTHEEKVGSGNIFLPYKGGYAKRYVQNDKVSENLNRFCQEIYVPRVKSIKRISDDSFIGLII